MKTYKKLIKAKKREYHEQVLNKMENMHHQDRDQFWKLLKSMKSNLQEEKLPELDKLLDYYKTLVSEDRTQDDKTIKTN